MRTEAKDGPLEAVKYENRQNLTRNPDAPVVNVLVTGFGPFREHAVNASWETVRLLLEEPIWVPQNLKPGTRINLILHQIPVIYQYVSDEMEHLWQKYKPNLTVHVGVSAACRRITLEQYAHNSGYNSPDILECIPVSNVCIGGGNNPDLLASSFDMKLVTTTLNTSDMAGMTGVVAEFSYDPGRYLCDFTYYKSLNIDRDRTAFIHVPPLNKPWSASHMARAIRICITEFLRQLQEKNKLWPASEFQDRQVNVVNNVQFHEP